MSLFIPPKHVDKREPEERVERTVSFQHSQDQRHATKPLDILSTKYILGTRYCKG